MLGGAVPALLFVAAALGLIWLTGGRRRRWRLRSIVLSVILSALITAALVYYTENIWQPFPDALPAPVIALIGVGVLGLVLLVPRVRHSTWPVRPLAVVISTVVLLAAANGVNIYYGQFPTLGALLGAPVDDELPAGVLPPSDQSTPPAHGDVAQLTIPGSFAARPAMIYLPPVYLVRNSPPLPVLILFAGQPGSPRDWFASGDLADRMDAFAAADHGFAPIVVVPDVLGSALDNPLCMDSRLGKVGTYLDHDVPQWIEHHLRVDGHWAVGGASNGGTCSLQTALRQPKLFPTFLDIAGQDEPTLGTREQTVAATFGGDEAAFRAQNPLDELATHHYPGLAAMLTTSDQDDVYGPQAQRVRQALEAAGVSVQFRVLPGRHGWMSFGPALSQALPWLVTRMGGTR
ncbi:enterochelin esterase-like enzyme [Labedaea rhizosphaerae]|uniref:Enterochelin esterase-like enzyme n=1 Tax=Labedaea rhizosphaerae TaxID=598644 RepID=A0A4R6SEX6_LABRH|nr:enterochelin esterase-like enzyme [Labedaea rhizosphaerae]